MYYQKKRVKLAGFKLLEFITISSFRINTYYSYYINTHSTKEQKLLTYLKKKIKFLKFLKFSNQCPKKFLIYMYFLFYLNDSQNVVIHTLAHRIPIYI